MKRSKGFWLASGIVAAFLLLPVRAVGQTPAYVPGDLVVLDHNLGEVVQTDSAGTLKRVVSTGLSTSNPVTRPQYLALGYATDGSVAAIFVSIPELDKIVRVDAVTGEQTTAASGGYLMVPRGVTLDNRGRLIVATAQGIVRVDVATGQQTLVAASGVGYVMAPYDVAVQADDQIIVADPELHGVYRVDPTTGGQVLVSDAFNQYPTGVTVDRDGSLLTTEVVTAYSSGRVVRLDQVTGSRTNVTASDYDLGYPANVDVEETGGILVADNTVTFSRLGGVFRVDPTTGSATKILSNAYSGAVYIDVAVVKTPSIARASQTITFAPIPDRTYGDPDFPVSATASSGLLVSFTAAGSCTIASTWVHLTGAGTCTVTATQGGDQNYTAAAPTSQSFSINKALTTVTILSSSPNPSNNQTSVTFTVSVSAVAPGLGGPTGSVQLLDGTTVIGTSAPSGGAALITVPPMTAGTHSITAIYGGSANFVGSASTSWTQTVSATTPVGTNITENIAQPPVSLTFSNVIAAGETTVTTVELPINDLQSIIGYFSLPGINLPFDGFLIRTTATFSGPIIITFTLPAGIDSTTFSETRILHDVGGTWIDQTILSPNSPAPNFATRQISAEVTSLSPFVIARWRLGPRSALRNVATVLRTLTGTTQDQQKIQSALGDLNKTMDPRLWVGNSETTLQSRAGGALFNDAKDAVTQLGNLFKQTTSRNLRNLLPSLIRNLTNAGRELARTAIATATAAGGKSSDLTHASGELARGDTAQLKGDLQSSMEHYRKAWMFAVSREVED